MKKSVRFSGLLVLMLTITVLTSVNAEVIHTKDGKQIQAKIDQISDGVVWYELTLSEDLTEYLGIELMDVEKIERDDGTPYNYAQPKTDRQ